MKKYVHVVLETRDYEDLATIFGFPVSNHKKGSKLLNKKNSEIGPIWRFGSLKPLRSVAS